MSILQIAMLLITNGFVLIIYVINQILLRNRVENRTRHKVVKILFSFAIGVLLLLTFVLYQSSIDRGFSGQWNNGIKNLEIAK
ncbi:hypothetical protein PZE06_21350 [Robertmurraya sp. DFI.2.37]|uniref:hypothetical protein n=1 Tax=Robertmurraya sp. DFI.2.37 TaxID=3031819 RepID=UPI0012486959|nr:hypothetical protein [Robertmurraya sp. DFI.2.37]MDF1510685.1 hypothetical protein [Robertmurraya sp. DFI.2.37]